jgi:hypothetical protein
LEDVVRHYTGRAGLDKPTLVRIVESIQSHPTDAGTQRFSGVPSDSTDSENDDKEFTIDPVSSTTAGKPPYNPCQSNLLD